MACASPTLALCGGRYRAAIVPVAKGPHGVIGVAYDIAAGRLVALKMPRATNAVAVREYRFFRAIRVAQDIGRAGDGGKYVVRLIVDFTEDHDQTWVLDYNAYPTFQSKRCTVEVSVHGVRKCGLLSGL